MEYSPELCSPVVLLGCGSNCCSVQFTLYSSTVCFNGREDYDCDGDCDCDCTGLGTVVQY